jgi:hypothetical protein
MQLKKLCINPINIFIMHGMTTIRPAVQPVVQPEVEQRRLDIIEDYKNLWVQIYNEDLPADLLAQFQSADINVLIRQYERERVQHIQDGLY